MISNKKGFLFTISVILFASTMVIFAQIYSGNNIGRENRILSNYAVLSQPFLVDNIANNIKRIVDFDFEISFVGDHVNIQVEDFLPKNSSITQNISDYNSFLADDFFKKISGTNLVDFSSLTDGSIELIFNDLIVYNILYDSNEAFFVSDSTLNQIDLNLFVRDDLNYFEWNSVSGDLELTVRYFDDSNYFSISESISSSESSSLNLVYEDSNVLITFMSDSNYFRIDSQKRVDFEISFLFDFDSNILPTWFNGSIQNSLRNFDSNSVLKIAG